MSKPYVDTHQPLNGSMHMGLKPPALLTFLLSFMVMMAVIFAKFFGAKIPGLNEQTEFAGMLVAYVVLAAGCLFRRL